MYAPRPKFSLFVVTEASSKFSEIQNSYSKTLKTCCIGIRFAFQTPKRNTDLGVIFWMMTFKVQEMLKFSQSTFIRVV